MITCEFCNKVLLTIQESTELEVTGEVKLVILCQGCKEVNYIKLYEYDQNRIRK